MSECPRHEDTSRRVAALEEAHAEQIRENARIWRAVNVIREEKASDSAMLNNLVAAVAELKDQLASGLAELRREIQDLKSAPIKRMDSVLAAAISSVVALIIGVLGALIFGGKLVP